MENFMEGLPAFLEDPGKVTDDTAEAVEMLVGIGEFEQFKDMMLLANKEREEGASGVGAAAPEAKRKLNVLGMEGLLDMCAQIAANEADPAGWDTILSTPFMTLEQKQVEEELRESNKQVYMRTHVTCDLDYKSMLDMLLNYTENRSTWDSTFKKFTLPKGGDPYLDETVIMDIEMNFGMLMHLCGIPRIFLVKWVKKWDYPSKGMVSYAMAPWNVADDCVDTKSMFQFESGVIKPHPTDPSKAILHGLTLAKTGGIPKWGLKIMSSFLPSYMKGMQSKYQAKILSKGLQCDLTPEGLRKRKPGSFDPLLSKDTA